MSKTRSTLSTLALALLAAAAGASTLSTYQQERADCLAGRSTQDRQTCLKEAAAAQAEARLGRLDSGATARQLTDNALARCKVVPADDRAACETLALGGGKRSGSVAEGAVLKELVTRRIEPAPPEPASAPAQ